MNLISCPKYTADNSTEEVTSRKKETAAEDISSKVEHIVSNNAWKLSRTTLQLLNHTFSFINYH